MDIKKEKEISMEEERISNLINIIPKGRHSVLDVGARDGKISILLTAFFKNITALDLQKPNISDKNIISLQGDVTHLEFPDDSFDTVICTEVLEHIPHNLLRKACDEISRVVKYDIVISVPYKQDIRVGRTTCLSCGKKNPPWGHVNVFDENYLNELFQGLICKQISFVGENKSKTNFVATLLMDLAGNSYGTYNQKERCIYCQEKLQQPSVSTLSQKIYTKLALYLNSIQGYFISPEPIWIYVVYSKRKFSDE
ncbi:MAG: class I SAM-dependent methyltransferase [Nitrospirota bacterium]